MDYQNIKEKHQDTCSKIFEDCGVFWAFSVNQFKEGLEKLKAEKKLNKGEKLTRIPAGGFIPSKNLKKMLDAMDLENKKYKKELKEAKKEKEAAILYELNNHECYYTGSIEPVKELFKGIYTAADIRKVFYNNNK